MKNYCGIDLGGTNIAAGIVDEEYHILASVSSPTPKGVDGVTLAAAIAKTAQEAAAKAGLTIEALDGVGMGTPGYIDSERGINRFAGNLGLTNDPMAENLSRCLGGKPVRIGNDANVAAYAESIAGASRGTRRSVMVTLGTGIGGGMILDGKLYEGCNFAAGEFGHFVIQYDGEICNCGRRGCFETYASATGLRRMALKAMKEEEGRRSLLWSLCGQDEDKVDGQKIFEAARRGDLTAESVVERYLYYLSVGITDIINIFQPEVLCIGGGVSRAKDQLLEPLKRLVDQQVYTRDSAVKTEIVIASLGNDAGIIGAAMLDD